MTMKMRRVYIAGPMSSSNPIQFLENLRKGTRVSTEVLLAGYAVFSPFIDYSLFFQCRDGEAIPLETIQAHSIAWLEVAEAVLLVQGWETSKGTLKELDRAYAFGIPVFHSIEELNTYFKA